MSATEQKEDSPATRKILRDRRSHSAVHSRSSRRSRIFISAVLVIFAAAVGEVSWLSHQKYQRKQENVAHLRSVHENLIRAVGGLTTAAGLIIRAHEQRFTVTDLNGLLDEYNRLQSRWDDNIDVLKDQLSRDFPSDEVKESWQDLLGELGDLDVQITALHGFDSMKDSALHAEQIVKCRKQVETVEQSLARLNHAVDKYVQAQR